MAIIKVATHNGFFHADEVLALAVLKIFFEKNDNQMEVVRTRDLALAAKCDIVVDIGEEYDEGNNRFDHHQKNKVADRENGIPYASFGLIWKHYASKITTSPEVAAIVERKLVMPIDALDSSVNISTPIFKGVTDYAINQAMFAIGGAFGDDEKDKAFYKAMEFAELILKGEIVKAEEKMEGEKATIIEILKQGEPEVLVLDKYSMWGSAVKLYKNIKLVIFPDKYSTNWCIQTATDSDGYNNDRIKFPEEWCGLNNEALSAVSGIEDCVFCHLGGWFAVSKTKDGAVKMANKTISSKL